MTEEKNHAHLRTISTARDSIAGVEEERVEKVGARNARLLSMYASGVPTSRIADAAGMTPSSVRKIATARDVGRGEERAVTDADEVNLDWLRRVVRSIVELDQQRSAFHDARNRSILAAAADGVPHQTLADTAGVTRGRVSRLVNGY